MTTPPRDPGGHDPDGRDPGGHDPDGRDQDGQDQDARDRDERDPLGLVARSHPLRGRLAQEMRLRRLPSFAAPARLLQIVLVPGEAGLAASSAQIAALRSADAIPHDEDARHATFTLGPLEVVWERHSEFVTYGFLLSGEFDEPFDLTAFAAVRPVIEEMPVAVIRATLVALYPVGGEQACIEVAAASLGEPGLVACDVAGGKARIWSDFRLGHRGLGSLLIVDRGLEGDEPAQLVQRLQELGNYRNMALLGLPVAQHLTPEVTRLEHRLSALTVGVAEPSSPDEPLLEELTFLSAELARLLAETRYRMSATQAYAKIVEERLVSLDVSPLPGRQTLTEFTDRRLMPAVRTCETFSNRLEDLSQRAGRTSSLLRTRIDTALARQNRDLLDSMDRRTQLQLRLQQAVEGLSVVAITYYLVALLDHILRAFPTIDHDFVIAVATPVVIVLVASQLLRFRHKVAERAPDRASPGTKASIPD